MPEGVTTPERPNLPSRLEHIEEQMKALHEIADRMRPTPDEGEKLPTAQGIEEATSRIETSAQRLIHRFASIADTVGQL